MTELPASNLKLSRLIPLVCVAVLIWPALWNGYPIVFADTGTYLSQAMHGYLGWDRPVFYSLFIWPLHLGLITWPVIVAQAGLTVLVLDLTRRAFDVSMAWLLALTVFLSVATWLPWTVSELMPDLFTPLLVLLLSLLVFPARRALVRTRLAITLLAAFMIATQLSSVPLAAGLLAVMIPLRWIATRVWKDRTGPVRGCMDRAGMDCFRGDRVEASGAPIADSTAIDPKNPRSARPPPVPPIHPERISSPSAFVPLLAPALAIAGLLLVSTVGFGRISLSPFGNVFVLARVIYDGPGMVVLRRDCPGSGWRLCPWLDRFPATSDEFLWDSSGPIVLAGGHKAVSADADAIIRAAVIAQPGRLLAMTWVNTIEQLTRFESGDGLENWNQLVGKWIDQDFPARESAAYHAARQQTGMLLAPPLLALAHHVTALTGIVGAAVLLPIAWRRRHVSALFLATALLALPLSAAITGGLSTPHDRYQSRIVWLPTCIACLSVPALWRRGRRAGATHGRAAADAPHEHHERVR